MMYQNRVYRDINEALPLLFQNVLERGFSTGSRNGDVRELTHIGVTLTRPKEREILLPARKANLAAQIAETMWVLSGRDDVAFLSHYLPRAADFSDDQEIWRGGYGKRLRRWTGGLDQLGFVVNLLKNDPLTRRAVMTIYDPVIDSADGLDIPCNNWLHFLQRDGLIDLHVAIRSNDLMWGWSGINQFEWSALLEVVAGLTGFAVGSLHFSISSLHVYKPHWDKGARIAQEKVHSRPMPTRAHFGIGTVAEFDAACQQWFDLEEKIRTQGSTVTLGEIREIQDPLLRSWMWVIAWWWTGDKVALEQLANTALGLAATLAMQPPSRPAVVVCPVTCLNRLASQCVLHRPSSAYEQLVALDGSFADFVIALHAEKNAAYGDSWKRRGEMLGIMANIARKIDRLGVGGAGDTAADTAIDLFVYLVKYRLWLSEFAGAQIPLGFGAAPTASVGLSDEPEYVARAIRLAEGVAFGSPANNILIAVLKEAFEDLEGAVTTKPEDRVIIVEHMVVRAYALAKSLWEDEQRV